MLANYRNAKSTPYYYSFAFMAPRSSEQVPAMGLPHRVI